MRRRGFLAALAAGAVSSLRPSAARGAEVGSGDTGGGGGAAGPGGGAPPASFLHGVRGPLATDALGTTLVHEHVLVDFGGAAVASRSRYDADEVFRVALPHLRDLRGRGCRTLFECTPAYLARDPLLLRRLAEASGLQIVTNTGYYGAARDIALPQHAFEETKQQLAARFIREFEDGIEGTGIRPGFVKLGVDPGPLSPIDRKLVEAGAIAHLATGLTLAVHTGDGRAAIEILGALEDGGVSPEAYVWVHAQNEPEPATRSRLAQQGAWVELDGIAPKTLDAHLAAVLDLRARDRLDRVLVSQDAGWYHVGEPGGGSYRPHTFLFDEFVPALRRAGLTDAEVRMLLVTNPARAFAVRRRPLAAQRGSRPATTSATSGGSER